MILAALLAVTATFSPAAPTVGDPITIRFGQPVVLDRSAEYEIVTQHDEVIVVRTFTPQSFALSGTTGGVRFLNLVVPVRSVMKKNDDFKPAPLAPPRRIAYPRAPFIAIGIAALCAIAAWALVWFRSRKRAVVVVPLIPAGERYRQAVLALRAAPADAQRWAALADATRAYLAETRPYLGKELTTTELVPRLADQERIAAEILRYGDFEKFSPWGAPERNFEEVADRALELAS